MIYKILSLLSLLKSILFTPTKRQYISELIPPGYDLGQEMGNLTLNISDYELKCHCGKCDVRIQDHEPVIQVVQGCCDHFARLHGLHKVILEITSPARCYTYNRLSVEEGGPGSNDESQHPRCNAMDIKLFIGKQQISPRKVYNYLNMKYPHKYGIGSYDNFTHIDTSPLRRRW